MAHAAVILNPISGSGRAGRNLEATLALARDTLARCGVSSEVLVTAGSGDAHRHARTAAASGVDFVVAWGGDGTINEVASALAFGEVPLGIVPAGSGNGLATELGLPRDAVRALEVAARGTPRVIDAGEVNGALFFNVAGVGLDAAIAARFATRGVQHRGLLGYLKLTTRALLQFAAQPYDLRFDAEALSRRALMISVANSRQYGNGAFIAPAAQLDDGRLELVVVEDQSLVRILWRLPSLFRGTLRDSRGLLMRTITTAAIAGASPLAFHVDGEPRSSVSPLMVRVRPRALKVLVASLPSLPDELAATIV